MNPSLNPLRLNCHEKCTEKSLHSVCIMPVRLRTKILDSMIERVNQISKRESKQATKRIWEYAKVEELWKR